MPDFNPGATGSAAGASAFQQAAAAGPFAASTDDLFAALIQMSWKGIAFPYIETDLELRQDLAIHKFVDRDGAHIEGTGRAPIQFTAKIPFINGLQTGKNENWSRTLYPTVWKEFFTACADKSTGLLIHPELGEFTCKINSVNTRWSGDIRGGVFVSASWIETDDGIDELNFAINKVSPTSNVQQAASALDQGIGVFALRPDIIPKSYKPPISFGDMVRSIRSVADQSTLLQKQAAGRLDNFIYEAQALEDSLNAAGNANALNWPLFQAAELGKSAAYDLKATLLSSGRKLGTYVVLKDSTLAQVAAAIGSSISDVITLNPAYLAGPLVFKDSVVRFYLPA